MLNQELLEVLKLYKNADEDIKDHVLRILREEKQPVEYPEMHSCITQ